MKITKTQLLEFFRDVKSYFSHPYSSHSSFSYTTVSYEEFRDNLNLEENDIIGAVFCTKNYEAVGHRDKDRSEWAIGFVYEDGPVNDGYFFILDMVLRLN